MNDLELALSHDSNAIQCNGVSCLFLLLSLYPVTGMPWNRGWLGSIPVSTIHIFILRLTFRLDLLGSETPSTLRTFLENSCNDDHQCRQNFLLHSCDQLRPYLYSPAPEISVTSSPHSMLQEKKWTSWQPSRTLTSQRNIYGFHLLFHQTTMSMLFYFIGIREKIAFEDYAAQIYFFLAVCMIDGYSRIGQFGPLWKILFCLWCL